jgi:hypothetical protein
MKFGQTQHTHPVSTLNPANKPNKLNKVKQKGFMPRKKTKPFNVCRICSDTIQYEQMYIYESQACCHKISLHDTCFTQWNAVNPGTCPNCRNQTTIVLTPIYKLYVQAATLANPANSSNEVTCTECLCGCFGILFLFELFSS